MLSKHKKMTMQSIKKDCPGLDTIAQENSDLRTHVKSFNVYFRQNNASNQRKKKEGTLCVENKAKEKMRKHSE
jgi:hypothetical protein